MEQPGHDNQKAATYLHVMARAKQDQPAMLTISGAI
jgi:hypothetical protein